MNVRRKSIHLTKTFFFIFLLFSPIYTQNLFPAAFGGSYRFNITLLTPQFDSYSIGDTPELWGQIINVGTNPLDAYTLIAEFTVIAPSGENIPAGSDINGKDIPSNWLHVFVNFEDPWTIPSDAESGPYALRVTISSSTYGISETETVYNAFIVEGSNGLTPIPKITSIDIPSEVNFGDWVTITVDARNDGGTADWMSIALSFPDLTTTYNIEVVDASAFDLGARPYDVGEEAGYGYGSDRRPLPYYPLVEASEIDWGGDASKRFVVRVKPEKSGTFKFYVKSVAEYEGGYAHHDPSSGITDQQNEFVYVRTLTVVPPIPKIVNIDYPSDVNPGGWATITVDVRNDGGCADWMSVALSFPDLSNLPDKSNILKVDDSDFNRGSYVLIKGDMAGYGYGAGERPLPEYPLVEGCHVGWSNGEIRRLVYRVKPEKSGTFTFYVKTVAEHEGKFDNHDPSSGITDQQNEYVEVCTINVRKEFSVDHSSFTVTPSFTRIYWFSLDFDNDLDEDVVIEFTSKTNIGDVLSVCSFIANAGAEGTASASQYPDYWEEHNLYFSWKAFLVSDLERTNPIDESTSDEVIIFTHTIGSGSLTSTILYSDPISEEWKKWDSSLMSYTYGVQVNPSQENSLEVVFGKQELDPLHQISESRIVTVFVFDPLQIKSFDYRANKGEITLLEQESDVINSVQCNLYVFEVICERSLFHSTWESYMEFVFDNPSAGTASILIIRSQDPLSDTAKNLLQSLFTSIVLSPLTGGYSWLSFLQNITEFLLHESVVSLTDLTKHVIFLDTQTDVPVADIFEGYWMNVFETGGITRIDIQLLSNGSISIHPWGSCHPYECDWGINVYSVTSNPFSMIWNHSFCYRAMTYKVGNDDLLYVNVYTHFTDDSGRADYEADYIFRRTPHVYFISDILFSKDVDDYTFEPIEVGETFYTDDEKVSSWIEFLNVTEALSVRWEWLDPSLTLYSNYTYEIPAPENEYWPGYVTWCWININGYYPEENPGLWKVRIFVNNNIVGYRSFYISAPDPIFSLDYVTPGVAVYGDTLTVMGSGVTSGNTVNVYWEFGFATVILNATTGLPDGTFECEVDVPSAYYGNHYIWAKDLATGLTERSDAIPVVSKITLSPSSGNEGDDVIVKGYGFSEYSEITFDYNGLAEGLGKDETDRLGYFEYTFEVDPTDYATYYIMTAEDEDTHIAEATFTLRRALIESVDISVYYDSWEYSIKTTEKTLYTWYLYDIDNNLVHTYESVFWATNQNGEFSGYIPDGEDSYIHLKVVSQDGDIEWWPSESEKYRINRPPPIPHQFWGDVTIDGLPAPDGTWVDIVIVTADGGEFYYWTETLEGSYGYDPSFNVPADDPCTPEIEGGVNGDTVYFYVDLVYATSYVFENGMVTELDLDVITAVYELQLYEGWNLISIPCIPEVPYIELMLYDILDYVESVWTYDGETGSWSSYSPWAPSDLYEMVDGKGYWIKVWADVLWEIDTG